MRYWTLLFLLLWSCDGLIGKPFDSQLVSIVDVGAGPSCTSEPLPTQSPDATRLTHIQYANIIEDLFGIVIEQTQDFAPDPIVGGFNNNAFELVVDSRLFNDYQLTAEAVATRIVQTPSAYAAAVPCAPQDAATCATALIQSNGRRIYRRPLTPEELAGYQQLFAQGADLYEEGTAFERGVRIVLETMLQSPHFLYRVELEGTPQTIDGVEVLPLKTFAIASRLAAILWASTPDDALLNAAGEGALDTPEGMMSQALRMADSPKFLRVVDDFHHQWLQAREFGTEPKVPALSETAGDSMRAELQTFVRDIAERNAPYAELMTSPHTFANADLAPLYDLLGDFDATPVRVDTDPTQRAGLLTQIGIMSAHAGASGTSPVKRGVFFLDEFACVHVEPPSFAVDPTLPERDETIVTTRDQVENHTANDTCQTCHRVINAAGFAFENYGARGEYRTLDNGVPVNASGRLAIKSEEILFDDAVELAHALVDTGIGPRCYVDKWYAYSFGKQLTSNDACATAVVDDAVRDGGHSIKDIVSGLTQTRAFRYRRLED